MQSATLNRELVAADLVALFGPCWLMNSLAKAPFWAGTSQPHANCSVDVARARRELHVAPSEFVLFQLLSSQYTFAHFKQFIICNCLHFTRD